MEEAFRTMLLETAPLAQLVGKRIDWGLRPQGDQLPGIALLRVSGGLTMHFTGPAGWRRDRVQVDVWGRTFKATRDIGDLLADDGGLLVGLRRDLPGVRIRTFVVARRGGTDADAVGPVHRDSIDVMIWHLAQ